MKKSLKNVFDVEFDFEYYSAFVCDFIFMKLKEKANIGLKLNWQKIVLDGNKLYNFFLQALKF